METNKMNLAMKRCCAAILTVVAATASATAYPPYDLYAYYADSTDNPPLNYTKVCEPGRTGEGNASYVVLGIWFPRAYPALANSAYDGDLAIPAYIDGLPVRKIKEAGFLACQRLRSVKIPSTVREIDERAFCWCTSLTNVTFEEGVQSIGAFAFSNCYNLVSVTLPASLSHIGEGCFEKCDSLRHVYFRGNAPRVDRPGNPAKSCLGEPWYNAGGPYERLKVHINRNTYGWIAPYVKGVPEKWPLDYGYMQAYETVAEDGGGTVVENTGFVTVITEIKGGAVAIPEAWAAQFPSYTAKFGGDFTASLTKPTGKKDAAGNDLQVWQDYVAGTDPTDVNDLFRAEIRIVDDAPVISWSPVLSAEEAAKRVYTIYGRQSLLSGEWTVVPSGQAMNYNFFKVAVEMKR